MIEQISRYSLEELERGSGFSFADRETLDHSVFLDLEHYIYRKPLALGIFGAAVREGDELVCTQYFLENKQDLKHLVGQSHRYLMEKREAGFHRLVAFAAKNDLMVLHAMFHKFGLATDLHDVFEVVDLQREFQKEFSLNIGLNALEEFAGIQRSGPSMSGSTIAKTFASIMADPAYIQRMPEEKRKRLLDYNREDVVNLFFVQANWPKISPGAVDHLIRERSAARQARAAIRTAPGEATGDPINPTKEETAPQDK